MGRGIPGEAQPTLDAPHSLSGDIIALSPPVNVEEGEMVETLRGALKRVA